jgi:hypothetical protein
MAVFTYGDSNITFSSFITWSNGETSLSNVGLNEAMGDMYPEQNPVAGNLRSITIFYGNVIAGANGTVSVSSPYTVAATSGTIQVKNVILSSYSITIVATPTYPYTFSGWRTAASGGGSLISTSATLTISTTANQTHTNYYAYFV